MAVVVGVEDQDELVALIAALVELERRRLLYSTGARVTADKATWPPLPRARDAATTNVLRVSACIMSRE